MSETLCKINNNKGNDNDILHLQGHKRSYEPSEESIVLSIINNTESFLPISIPKKTTNHYFNFFSGSQFLYNHHDNGYNTIDSVDASTDYMLIDPENRKNIKLNSSFDFVAPDWIEGALLFDFKGLKIKKSGYYKIDSHVNVWSNNSDIYVAFSIFKFRPFIYNTDDNTYKPWREKIQTYKIIDSLWQFSQYKDIQTQWKISKTKTHNPTERASTVVPAPTYNYNSYKINFDKNWNNLNYIHDDVNWAPYVAGQSEYRSTYEYYNAQFIDGFYDVYGTYYSWDLFDDEKFNSSKYYLPYYCIANSQERTVSNNKIPLDIIPTICYLNEGDVIFPVYSAQNVNSSNSYTVDFFIDDTSYFNIENIGSYNGKGIIEYFNDDKNHLMEVSLADFSTQNNDYFIDFTNLKKNQQQIELSPSRSGDIAQINVLINNESELVLTEGINKTVSEEKHKYIVLDIRTRYNLSNPLINQNDVDDKVEELIELYTEPGHYWVQVDVEQLTTEGTPLVIEDNSITITLVLVKSL